MKTDSNLLPHGTGTPYVAIFNGSGNPIIDKYYGRPIGMFVSKFNYRYKEEGGDEGEITIETGNPDIVSHQELDYLRPLKLQWGWLYPDGNKKIGPVRSVIVKDHNIDFTPEGVNFTIKFCDATILLKTQVPQSLQPVKDLESFLTQALKGTVLPISVIDFKTSTYFTPVLGKVIPEQESQ